MKLSTEEIKYIADLARLKLTPDEEARYSRELSAILDYIDQLAKVNTFNVDTSSRLGILENSWREDEVKPWSESELELALSQVIEREGNQVKVKKVFV